MSAHTEHSLWSPDEVDSLENIDKEVQLVSTSTDTHSTSNQTGSGGHGKVISSLKGEARQSNLNVFHSKSYDNLQAIKCHDDGNKPSFKFCDNGDGGQKQSKIKGTSKTKVTAETANKQDYLEQINKQLTKELDEKNAILSLLQENYERLLFKYAEAQNRIDELRIKFLAEKPESKSYQAKYEILNNHIPHFCDEDHPIKPDVRSQKVVAPFISLDEPQTPPPVTINRPSSLPLDNGLKYGEKDLLKATTPTDSEGLSSIITSMSGHSKILNSLDEENHKKSNYFKCKKNYLLQETVSDPFDKVKNWQNSLPPLEQIETPETTLYNVNNAYSSGETNYKEISSPKNFFSDESCPLSWREESHVRYDKRSKISPEREEFHEGLKEKSPSQNNVRGVPKRGKPPLLRCSSLPAYSVRSGSCKNGIYIPPLDLNNVTLSDDESYCQQDYYKSNGATSSFSSRDDSLRRQTPFSSSKATISEERVPRQTVSTSMTPDRTNECQCCSDKTRCNVCGVCISGDKTTRFFGSRSNSCESVRHRDVRLKEAPARRSKPPFKRSVSFGSGTNTPRYSSHDKHYFSELNECTIEDFDVYASTLKARSQVVMKALTAHVNNS